jgi:hypothetical protein
MLSRVISMKRSPRYCPQASSTCHQHLVLAPRSRTRSGDLLAAAASDGATLSRWTSWNASARNMMRCGLGWARPCVGVGQPWKHERWGMVGRPLSPRRPG